jgi:hypothetical protein
MKCVICKSSDIEMRKIEEEIKLERDICADPDGSISLFELRRKIL